MEKEISSGAMLGIVLIALAAIIGLGFGVFAIAKGTANEGVTNVQENLDAVGQSAYTDYDQKIVTGTQVMSCYQNFNGKNVAVLIATQALKDKDDSTQSFLSGAGVGAAYGYASGSQTATSLGNLPVVMAKASGDDPTKLVFTDTTGIYDMRNSKNAAVSRGLYINYNALLSGAQGKKNDGTTDSNPGGGIMYFDSNCFKTTAGFATVAGKVLFNNITANMSKSGMMEYVPSGARFQSYLVKDASGTIMGIAFEQIGTGR